MTTSAFYPGYALVTGASEGIGLAFCHALAKRGYALVLVARTESRLAAVAKEIKQTYGIDAQYLTQDLAQPKAAQAIFDELQTRGISIKLLINNAGLLFNGYFTELSLERQEQLLACNMTALTGLCHLFANQMRKQGGGHIINLASTAAWMAIPNENCYAASKAYVLSFSLALADELQAMKSGVSVTALCPSYTHTKMLNNTDQGAVMKIPAWLQLSPEFVAEAGVKAALKGKRQCIPGWSNRFAMGVIQCFPKVWVSRLFGWIYRRAQQ